MNMIVVIIDYSKTSAWTMVHVRFVDHVSIDLLLCVQRIQTIFPSVAIIIVVVIITAATVVLGNSGCGTTV